MPWEAFDWSQFGMAGIFIGYLIYDRNVVLKKIVEKFDRHEKLFYKMYSKIDNATHRK